MRIQITKVDGTRIEFKSEYGSCRGVWRGAVPDVGCDYEIELECSACSVMTDEIQTQTSIQTNPSIAVDGNRIVLNGLLESIDSADQTSIMRLGTSILVVPLNPGMSVGQWIKVTTPDLVLWDTAI